MTQKWKRHEKTRNYFSFISFKWVFFQFLSFISIKKFHENLQWIKLRCFILVTQFRSRESLWALRFFRWHNLFFCELMLKLSAMHLFKMSVHCACTWKVSKCYGQSIAKKTFRFLCWRRNLFLSSHFQTGNFMDKQKRVFKCATEKNESIEFDVRVCKKLG